jgi:hypothetical protein
MSAKLVFLTGVLGVGGYVGYEMSHHDATVFNLSKKQVQSMLVDAKTTLPRRDGDGKIEIWGVARSDKGVKLSMQYASWAPVLKCEAVITEVAADKSRVAADCGDIAGKDAIAKTESQLRVPMFEEHIDSTLRQRAFNRAIVDRKEMAAVMRNMGGMQREALKRADEMQQMQAEVEESTR